MSTTPPWRPEPLLTKLGTTMLSLAMLSLVALGLAAPAQAQSFSQGQSQEHSPEHSQQYARIAPQSLSRILEQLAPGASPQVLKLAAQALNCADPDAKRLAVIDFSRSANEKRLWVFDLQQQRLLFKELVSHGKGTGQEFASDFSNMADSHQSSLGLFRTKQSYTGRNGYSLRLEGLEPGINDRAFERAIVIHGADYVSEDFIAANGRLGRSWGCPAVPSEVAKPLIDSLEDNQYLFAYYPDPQWLDHSEFLACQSGAGQRDLAFSQAVDTGDPMLVMQQERGQGGDN
ncbi:L,D-transpeptidase catalytic domain [Onishia taeanensis]|uniref:L,D-transpeptidase catalytic domain n=1 Tax=Onishia taeanensis TaxID=284577 RepID=A0A1G7U713_9GAMM|nr:murein L,D-transpeptidase catalytic domain family protein [Halomonas taeanensis]SDG43168.1 L,D-transpeptidase catalytic domain [Halomonas taeanensis]